MSSINFSALKSVAYPARWTPPRYRFGQQVMHLGATVATITGLRYTVAWPGDEHTPVLYEWQYELESCIWVSSEVLEPAEMRMCA